MAAPVSTTRQSSPTTRTTPTPATTRTTRSSASTTHRTSVSSKATSNNISRSSLTSTSTTSSSLSSQSTPSASIQSSPKQRSSPFGPLSVGAFVGIMIAVVIVIGLILMVLTSLRRRRREARRRPRGVITSTYLPEDSSAETFEAQHLPMPFEPVGGRSAHLNSGGHYAAIPSMSSHAGSLVHLNPGHVGYAHSWRGSPEPHNSGVVDYRDTWRSTSVPPAAAMEYTPSFSGSGIRPTASEPTNESWGALPSPHDSPYLAPRQLPPIFGSALRVAPNQHGFLPQGSETGQTH